MSFVRLLRFGGIVFGMAAIVCCAAGGVTKATNRPPPEQQQKLTDLLARLSRHQPTTPQWLELAEKIADLGEAGRERLRPVLNGKLRALDRTYRTAFHASAQRLRVARFAKTLEEEGKTRAELSREAHEARQAVLTLTKKSDLSTSDLRRTGSPAMKRLTELFTVNRQAVLDADEALRARRAHLLKLWALEARCKPAGTTKPDRRPQGDERLAHFEHAEASLVIPMTAAARRTIEANAVQALRIRPEEADGIRDLNRMRALLGLRVLAIDVRLCKAARDHCTDMRTKRFFSHTSPVPGKRSLVDRARRAGTTAHAENIIYGARTGPQANRMWFHSPGHMKNMFRNFRRVGLGHDGPWTQMFGY